MHGVAKVFHVNGFLWESLINFYNVIIIIIYKKKGFIYHVFVYKLTGSRNIEKLRETTEKIVIHTV